VTRMCRRARRMHGCRRTTLASLRMVSSQEFANPQLVACLLHLMRAAVRHALIRTECSILDTHRKAESLYINVIMLHMTGDGHMCQLHPTTGTATFLMNAQTLDALAFRVVSS
jgi:6-phosphogluconolactonase/glucosamine-6-phosphate isomerase/deaminase